MAMQPVLLVSVKNLAKFLEALRHAQAPEKVALRFIEELGFTSTNDRLFIPLLKAMKFLDEAGKPTARYHSFLDDTRNTEAGPARRDQGRLSRSVPSEQERQLSIERATLREILKSITEGKLSPAVLGNVTKTFIELVKLADFTGSPQEEQASERPGDERTVEIEDALALQIEVTPTRNRAGELVATGQLWFIASRLCCLLFGIKQSPQRDIPKREGAPPQMSSQIDFYSFVWYRGRGTSPGHTHTG